MIFIFLFLLFVHRFNKDSEILFEILAAYSFLFMYIFFSFVFFYLLISAVWWLDVYKTKQTNCLVGVWAMYCRQAKCRAATRLRSLRRPRPILRPLKT